MTIPVIDFSKLEGEGRKEVMAQIANGCEEWGFFQLINHGIPRDLLERVKEVCTRCYKLEREANFYNSKPVQLLRGGGGGNDRIIGALDDVDWEDVFFLEDDKPGGWPSNPPEFKETMKEYREELKKLAEKMLGLMEENLGIQQGYIKKAFCGGGAGQPFFGTKVSHYPPCPEPEAVNGLRAHTDAGGLILLFQDDEVAGLQLLKNGRWIDVQPLPDAIVINTGDQIEVLSNGRYKSAWHRILAMPAGNRRSVASFYNPSLAATIAPAPEIVAADRRSAVKELKMATSVEAANKTTGVVENNYPEFVFGNYMAVYAEQKFKAKEPRFHAMACNQPQVLSAKL